MKIIAWNTGRMYSNAGQRMAAVKLEDGKIVFADRDRQIRGVLNAIGHPKIPLQKEFVMRQYDENRYKWDTSMIPEDVMEALSEATRQVRPIREFIPLTSRGE